MKLTTLAGLCVAARQLPDPRHLDKEWIFLAATLMMLLSGILVSRPKGRIACTITGRQGCEVAGRFTKALFWASTVTFLAGAIFAYAFVPILNLLDGRLPGSGQDVGRARAHDLHRSPVTPDPCPDTRPGKHLPSKRCRDMNQMIRLLGCSLVVLLLLAAAAPGVHAQAQEKGATVDKPDVVMHVKGLSCEMCARKVSTELKKIDAVDQVQVLLEKEQRVLLTFKKDGKVSEGKLREAVTSAGFSTVKVTFAAQEGSSSSSR